MAGIEGLTAVWRHSGHIVTLETQEIQHLYSMCRSVYAARARNTSVIASSLNGQHPGNVILQ